MSKRSIRIRLESMSLFRRLALLLLAVLTCCAFRPVHFYGIWRSGIERKHCGRFGCCLFCWEHGSSGLFPLRCMSCLMPALNGLGMVVYSILDPWGSDSLLFVQYQAWIYIYYWLFRDSPLTIDTNLLHAHMYYQLTFEEPP